MLFMVVAVCCGKQMNATSGFEKCESSICEPTKRFDRDRDEWSKVLEINQAYHVFDRTTRFGLNRNIKGAFCPRLGFRCAVQKLRQPAFTITICTLWSIGERLLFALVLLMMLMAQLHGQVCFSFRREENSTKERVLYKDSFPTRPPLQAEPGRVA